MAKIKYVQIRVSDEEDKFIEELAEDYSMDRSKLILFALEYISEKRPSFVIEPRPKEMALASKIA